jgi:hypothetical protein
MGTAQKFLQESEFVHQFQSGWMNSVSSKITQKTRVLFEDNHVHARSREKEAQDHSGRAAASDAASRLQFLSGFLCT